jgi:hypothetical protein
MENDATSWIWAHCHAKGVDKLIMLALFRDSDPDHPKASPSIAEITDLTGVSRGSVDRSIGRLESTGQLKVGRTGGRKSRTYMAVGFPTSHHVGSSLPELPTQVGSSAVQLPTQVGSSAPPNFPPGREVGRQTNRPEIDQPALIDDATLCLSTTDKPSGYPPSVGGGLQGGGDAPRGSIQDRMKRGSRLPEPFVVTDEMIDWARTQTPLVGRAETDRFIDYWRGIPGYRGVKLDWLATWHNWMRKAQDEAQRRIQPKPVNRRSTTDERVAQALALAAEFETHPQPRELTG